MPHAHGSSPAQDLQRNSFPVQLRIVCKPNLTDASLTELPNQLKSFPKHKSGKKFILLGTRFRIALDIIV